MTELARAVMPDGGELVLCRRGADFEIRCNGWELMSSRAHASEEALARLACAELPPAPRMLIGGLGMGFTLRAALDLLSDSSVVIVVELVAEIIAWNRGPLAALAGRPLDDARVAVHHGDVADALAFGPFDAILLDIDNGPAAAVLRDVPRIYAREGLSRVRRALAPSGVLAVWSADRCVAFEEALAASQLRWRGVAVPADNDAAVQHTIYLARAIPSPAPAPRSRRR